MSSDMEVYVLWTPTDVVSIELGGDVLLTADCRVMEAVIREIILLEVTLLVSLPIEVRMCGFMTATDVNGFDENLK